jgi:hypothetical protein
VITRHPISVRLPLWVVHDLSRVTDLVGCSPSHVVEVLMTLAESRLSEILLSQDRRPYPISVQLRLGEAAHTLLLSLASDKMLSRGSVWRIESSRLARLILIHFLAAVDTGGCPLPIGPMRLPRSLDLALPGGLFTLLRPRDPRVSQ